MILAERPADDVDWHDLEDVPGKAPLSHQLVVFRCAHGSYWAHVPESWHVSRAVGSFYRALACANLAPSVIEGYVSREGRAYVFFRCKVVAPVWQREAPTAWGKLRIWWQSLRAGL